MKALTLTQPWATLILLGAKTYETRSWATTYRGPLAIHAAQGLAPVGGKRGLRQIIDQPAFFEALRALVPQNDRYCDVDAILRYLPLGAVLGTCRLLRCIPTDPVRGALDVTQFQDEHAFGDFSPGRYAWQLGDVQAYAQPIPAKGELGLWEWEVPS